MILLIVYVDFHFYLVISVACGSRSLIPVVPQGGAAVLKCRWALFGLAAWPLVGSGTEAGHTFYSSLWPAMRGTTLANVLRRPTVSLPELTHNGPPSLIKGGPTSTGTPRSWHYVLVETHEAQEQHYAGQALVHSLTAPSEVPTSAGHDYPRSGTQPFTSSPS